MKRVPLWFKIIYTTFLGVLVPYYWVTYTGWNFLYFCDMALLVTCVGLWLESSFLVSTQAVGIVLPQMLWIADLLSRLVGVPITGQAGMTSYMFDSHIPLFVRGLSLFHGWLPLVLLWLPMRLGYDRRAFMAQTAFGVTLLVACYGFAPAPPASLGRPSAAVNINYVYGLNNAHAQSSMAPGVWFSLLTTFVVLGLYLPTHLALRKVFATAMTPPRTSGRL
jgi:hypothetical protein